MCNPNHSCGCGAVVAFPQPFAISSQHLRVRVELQRKKKLPKHLKIVEYQLLLVFHEYLVLQPGAVVGSGGP